MFVHAGTHLYGKVDQVPGLLHVGTQFFHVNFVPLIPTGSFIILEGVERKEDEGPGIAIPLDYRSMFYAWLRTALMVGGGLAFITAAIEGFRCLARHGDGAYAAGMAVVGVVLAAFLPFTYRMTRAAPLRALGLARLAGIEPEVVAKYFVNHPSLADIEQFDRQGA
jgi:hypothetical protein